jgi:hypothetical protein
MLFCRNMKPSKHLADDLLGFGRATMKTAMTAGTTFLIEAETMKELREIAQADRRSLGFEIRDAVVFWLAERRRLEAKAGKS